MEKKMVLNTELIIIHLTKEKIGMGKGDSVCWEGRALEKKLEIILEL